MGQQEIKAIAAELAAGYPGSDKAGITQEFQNIVEIVLPLLAQRTSLARERGMEDITQTWEFIRKDSEGLFEKALAKAERVKVIYVASKFMNNKLIGELVTKQALEIARHNKKENGNERDIL